MALPKLTKMKIVYIDGEEVEIDFELISVSFPDADIIKTGYGKQIPSLPQTMMLEGIGCIVKRPTSYQQQMQQLKDNVSKLFTLIYKKINEMLLRALRALRGGKGF